MAINRRNFVKLALLSSGMVFASSPEIKALHRISKRKGLVLSNQDWIDSISNGRKALEKREYIVADSYYRQAIELGPDKIQGYDGLKKVFMSQNRMLEATELCRIGWKKNPNKAAFVDRFSSSLRRLVMGNGKQTVDFINKHGEGQLLEQAAKLYIEALASAPDKNYLRIGLREVKESMEIAQKNAERLGNDFPFDSVLADQMDSAISTLAAKKRKKQDLSLLSDVELELRIDSLSNTRSILHFDDARESRTFALKRYSKKLYQAQVNKKLNNQDWEGALAAAETITQIDSTDSTNYALRKRLYRKMKNYPKMVEIAREKSTLEPVSFWNEIGLAKALTLSYHRHQRDEIILQEMMRIYSNLNANWEEPTNEQMVASCTGLAKCHRIKKEYDQSMNLLQSVVDNVVSPSEHMSVTLMTSIGKTVTHQSSRQEGISALKFFLGTRDSTDTALISFKSKLTSISSDDIATIPLQHYLAKLYKRDDKIAKAKRTYRNILKLQPDDRMAQRKLKAL